jgi:hypothetical protein
VYISGRRGGYVFLCVLVDHTSFVVRRVITATHDTSGITRCQLSVALIYQMVTGTFDTPRIEMAVIFCMPISLAVCTLCNTPFMFGRYEFILKCCMYSTLKLSLLFGAGFNSTKKHGERTHSSIFYITRIIAKRIRLQPMKHVVLEVYFRELKKCFQL